MFIGKIHFILLSAAAALLIAACQPGTHLPSATGETHDAELAIEMAWSQRWVDKLARAAHAENWTLADFYLHELEEAAQGWADKDLLYEGHPIGKLTASMLLPAIESLEVAVKAKNPAQFSARYTTLIATCNACHAATEHAFVRIALPDLRSNPWAQDFSPLPTGN